MNSQSTHNLVTIVSVAMLAAAIALIGYDNLQTSKALTGLEGTNRNNLKLISDLDVEVAHLHNRVKELERKAGK